MSRIAYVNGRYVPQRHAMVNIEDRGYQFADGVYEVIYVNGGRFIDADLHLNRLDRSLNELRIRAPLGRKALLQVLNEVLQRNRVRDGLIYMQITRGVARRDHGFPAASVAPAIVVTAKRLTAFPTDITAWTTTVVTRPDERWARCDIKSVALLPNVLARQAAREQGAGEAILVDASGTVTEGSSANVWMVDEEGTLRSRHLDNHILPGCTRAALVSLLEENGIAYRQTGFTVDELSRAREVFLTSASSFVKPVLSVDGRKVGDGAVGPVARQLFALFSRHVLGAPRNAPGSQAESLPAYAGAA
jgi:D-alanine transaminase